MNKHGFTLIELLVVIALIAILSLIIVPSVINVNKNVNRRMLNQKMENIESGATLYASKNDDIFNGVDEVYIFVYELIDYGYVTIDVDTTDARCAAGSGGSSKGCVLDPTVSSATLNNDYVILRKQGAGYSAEYVHLGPDPEAQTYSDKSLVEAVCDGFLQENFIGRTPSGKTCFCYNNSGNKVGIGATTIKDSDGTVVDACIISGENPNNYLRYGDSKPNWRVLGVYRVPDENNGNNKVLTAKMITSEPI